MSKIVTLKEELLIPQERSNEPIYPVTNIRAVFGDITEQRRNIRLDVWLKRIILDYRRKYLELQNLISYNFDSSNFIPKTDIVNNFNTPLSTTKIPSLQAVYDYIQSVILNLELGEGGGTVDLSDYLTSEDLHEYLKKEDLKKLGSYNLYKSLGDTSDIPWPSAASVNWTDITDKPSWIRDVENFIYNHEYITEYVKRKGGFVSKSELKTINNIKLYDDNPGDDGPGNIEITGEGTVDLTEYINLSNINDYINTWITNNLKTVNNESLIKTDNDSDVTISGGGEGGSVTNISWTDISGRPDMSIYVQKSDSILYPWKGKNIALYGGNDTHSLDERKFYEKVGNDLGATVLNRGFPTGTISWNSIEGNFVPKHQIVDAKGEWVRQGSELAPIQGLGNSYNDDTTLLGLIGGTYDIQTRTPDCSWHRISTTIAANVDCIIYTPSGIVGQSLALMTDPEYFTAEEVRLVINGSEFESSEYGLDKEWYFYNKGLGKDNEEIIEYRFDELKGCIVSTILKLQTFAPNAVIILCTPLKRNIHALKQKDIVDAIIDVGKRYSLPVLDLYYTGGVNDLNINNWNIYSEDNDIKNNTNKYMANLVTAALCKYRPKLLY